MTLVTAGAADGAAAWGIMSDRPTACVTQNQSDRIAVHTLMPSIVTCPLPSPPPTLPPMVELTPPALPLKSKWDSPRRIRVKMARIIRLDTIGRAGSLTAAISSALSPPRTAAPRQGPSAAAGSAPASTGRRRSHIPPNSFTSASGGAAKMAAARALAGSCPPAAPPSWVTGTVHASAVAAAEAPTAAPLNRADRSWSSTAPPSSRR